MIYYTIIFDTLNRFILISSSDDVVFSRTKSSNFYNKTFILLKTFIITSEDIFYDSKICSNSFMTLLLDVKTAYDSDESLLPRFSFPKSLRYRQTSKVVR
jgi:hypothetical protein